MATTTPPTETKITRKDEADYFREAASWDDDRVIALMKSRRTGWLVAGSEFVLVLLLAVAIVLMLPLKTTEVRLVRVDSSTGIIEV